jgi:hypothetical protein
LVCQQIYGIGLVTKSISSDTVVDGVQQKLSKKQPMNKCALILKGLFNRYPVHGGSVLLNIRGMIALFQVPPTITAAVFSIAYHNFFPKKRRKYIIGPIDVQANILKIKAALEGEAISVNIRYQTAGFKYKGIWDKNIFKQYDYSISGNYFGRIFVAPWLFGWLLGKGDVFIYISDAGYFISKLRSIDYVVLKFFGKKTVSFFSGCDARARGPATEHANRMGVTAICNACSLICDDRLRKLEASLHEEFNQMIFNSIDQSGYIKKYIPFDSIAYPFISESEFDFEFTDVETINIIHAANNKAYRGSEAIEAVFMRLNGRIINGKRVNAKVFMGIERNSLMEEMKKAHIYVNSLYGFSLGLASIEASARGCIFLTSARRELNQDLPYDYPGISVEKKNLEETLLRICSLEFKEMKTLARDCYKYANNYHSYKNAGLRLKKIINEID